jgi:hypothetical protein
MALTPAEFKTRFPEFVAEADQRVQYFIDDADPSFNEEMWAGFYKAGVANYVAHHISKASVNATTAYKSLDIVTGKKVGDMQINKSANALLMGMEEPMLTTNYGAEYLRLRSLVASGGLAV